MGYKSKATKANKAKKVDRPPIKRIAEGIPFVVRTDLPVKRGSSQGQSAGFYQGSGLTANEWAEEMAKEGVRSATSTRK